MAYASPKMAAAIAALQRPAGRLELPQSDDEWRAHLLRLQRQGVWPEGRLGPAPGRRGCRCPRRLVDEIESGALIEDYEPRACPADAFDEI